MLFSRFFCVSLLFLLLPFAVHGQFNFTTNNGAITITSYTGASAAPVIPSTTNGYPVVSIGNSVFEDFPVTNVTIPSSVTNIGNNAFTDCTHLISVAIPGSVTYIGLFAFSECSSLTSATISNGVAGIGGSAFFECSSLTNVTIPGSVADLGGTAFEDCSRLRSVTISNGVTSIGNYAFGLCADLANVTIPESVTNIGDAPFLECSALTNIFVDTANPAYSSLNGILFDKAQATLVTYPAGRTNSVYSIPASVTSVGMDALRGCVSLTSLTILGGVTSIGGTAFANCPSLKFAYFLGSAPPDAGNAFYGTPATVYYLPGTSGWSATFGGVPTVLWDPQATAFTTVGGQFAFSIAGPTNATIVLEACTNLANAVWLPVSTNMLSSSGASSFNDLQWTNYPIRYYRFSAP